MGFQRLCDFCGSSRWQDILQASFGIQHGSDPDMGWFRQLGDASGDRNLPCSVAENAYTVPTLIKFDLPSPRFYPVPFSCVVGSPRRHGGPTWCQQEPHLRHRAVRGRCRRPGRHPLQPAYGVRSQGFACKPKVYMLSGKLSLPLKRAPNAQA